MEKIWKYAIHPDEVIRTEIGTVFVNAGGILVMKYCQNLEFTLEKAKAAIKICEEIVGGNKVLVMILTGNLGQMPIETREYLSSEKVGSHRKAVALVIDNLPHRIFARFIIKKRNKYYPSAIFKNEEEALIWLKKFE